MVSAVSKPASVLDVAAYILEHFGRPLSSWKLQKLCYYSQAWSLVWNGEDLFSDAIEAWRDGPVVRALYNATGYLDAMPGDVGGEPQRLHPIQISIINRVLSRYGQHNGHTLSELTHTESPWQEARGGLAPGAYGSNVIPTESIMNYYRSKADDAEDRLEAMFQAAAGSLSLQEATQKGQDAFESGDVVAADDVLDSL